MGPVEMGVVEQSLLRLTPALATYSRVVLSRSGSRLLQAWPLVLVAFPVPVHVVEDAALGGRKHVLPAGLLAVAACGIHEAFVVDRMNGLATSRVGIVKRTTMDLESSIQILDAVDVALGEPAIGIGIALYQPLVAWCGCLLRRGTESAIGTGSPRIGVRGGDHFDGAFGHPSQVIHAIAVDIRSLRPPPGDMCIRCIFPLRAWFRMFIVLRSRFRACATGDEQMPLAVRILPQHHDLLVIDPRAAS